MTITVEHLAVDFFKTIKIADLSDGYELHEVKDEKDEEKGKTLASVR